MAQAKSLKAEVLRLDPGNPFFRATGRRFEGGLPQTRLDLVYEAAFDEMAATVRIPVSSRSHAR